MTSRLAYIAGPLFDDGERWWIEKVAAAVADAGYETFLPHRDNVAKTAETVGVIYRVNCDAIERATVVVASLNGVTTDDGTAWEIGYAAARGVRIIGIHTDWRRRFDHEVVNLMIECSLESLVHSTDDLVAALTP